MRTALPHHEAMTGDGQEQQETDPGCGHHGCGEAMSSPGAGSRLVRSRA